MEKKQWEVAEKRHFLEQEKTKPIDELNSLTKELRECSLSILKTEAKEAEVENRVEKANITIKLTEIPGVEKTVTLGEEKEIPKIIIDEKKLEKNHSKQFLL